MRASVPCGSHWFGSTNGPRLAALIAAGGGVGALRRVGDPSEGVRDEGGLEPTRTADGVPDPEQAASNTTAPPANTRIAE